MSKTDKDAPFWVQNLDGIIEHDHRSGECIVGDGRNRWSAWHDHWRRCKKRVEVVEYCTKENPHRTWYREKTCWYTAYVRSEDEAFGYGRFVNVRCDGHSHYVTDNTIPCVCDDRPPTATCTPGWNVGSRYTWGGVPSEFVRTYYHKPERARERRLRDLAREYNAYGDLEDGDFINRQARNSARWDYW